jgi:hypothetical protein
VQRRWKQWVGALVAALTVAAGCSDDDDDGAGDTTEPAAESTVPGTTEPPPETTEAPTTTTTTTSTVPPSTTMSEEDLKAQIAADYQRSWQLRRELIANPTLDGLDEKLAQISAPGSADYNMSRDFVTELASAGDRVVPGTPDEFRIDIERVELVGNPPHQEARVTMCWVANPVRVNSEGAVVTDFGLVAARRQDHVVLTPGGWLPDGQLVDYWQGLGVTECPPA